MTRTTVVINENQLLTIVGSCIEPFPSKYLGSRSPRNLQAPEGEAIGLLFGTTKDTPRTHTVHINLTITLSVIHYRSDTEIWIPPRNIDRVIDTIERSSGLELVGRYHSHPCRAEEFSTELSEFSDTDRENILLMADEYDKELIEIIVAISPGTKRQKTNGHTLSGKMGKYAYIAAAYVTNRGTYDLYPVKTMKKKK